MRALNKPEYLYRPTQIIRRLLHNYKTNEQRTVELPWGQSILIHPDEDIGRAICTLGLYDLVVTETISRLLDAGEVGVDIGANVGYMSCVMAWAAGPGGTILSFEPSDSLFNELQRNTANWNGQSTLASIQTYRLAVSSRAGMAQLRFPAGFGANRGIASLELAHAADGGTENVETVTLDGVLASTQNIGLLKLDVEGHEAAVLEGAARLLASGSVRDIVFEEHGVYPSETHTQLAAHGYQIFRLSRTVRRILLLPANDMRRLFDQPSGVLPNYLATLDSARCRDRLASPGWLSLR